LSVGIGFFCIPYGYFLRFITRGKLCYKVKYKCLRRIPEWNALVEEVVSRVNKPNNYCLRRCF